MKLKDLAFGLGISPAMVTKLKQRGMPVTSVEAAEKWRRRHLEFARTKGTRAGSERKPVGASGHVSTADDASAAALLEASTAKALLQVRELGLLAHEALGRGTFAVVAPLLRRAMARVPHEARDKIGLSVEVWDALTAAIPHDLVPGQEAAGDPPVDFMGIFWMQIALGEHADMMIVSGK